MSSKEPPFFVKSVKKSRSKSELSFYGNIVNGTMYYKYHKKIAREIENDPNHLINISKC